MCFPQALFQQKIFLKVARIHKRTIQKSLYDPDTHNGVIIHPRHPGIQSQVGLRKHHQWGNTASGGDGIPAELFQILKYNTVKVLHSICQQIWKTQQWPEAWKRSIFIPIPKKGKAKVLKLPHNFTPLTHQQSNAQNSPSQAPTVCEL